MSAAAAAAVAERWPRGQPAGPRLRQAKTWTQSFKREVCDRRYVRHRIGRFPRPMGGVPSAGPESGHPTTCSISQRMSWTPGPATSAATSSRDELATVLLQCTPPSSPAMSVSPSHVRRVSREVVLRRTQDAGFGFSIVGATRGKRTDALKGQLPRKTMLLIDASSSANGVRAAVSSPAGMPAHLPVDVSSTVHRRQPELQSAAP